MAREERGIIFRRGVVDSERAAMFARVVERAWPDGRVGGVRHLSPRKVRAPWADCQVTPGRSSRTVGCCDGQCHRKHTADVVERSITGKGEKVG